jgi:hypothetical protein
VSSVKFGAPTRPPPRDESSPRDAAAARAEDEGIRIRFQHIAESTVAESTVVESTVVESTVAEAV